MTRAELRAACTSWAVPMPRFRRPIAGPMTLTEAVLRVLSRAQKSARPFAVFVVEGKLILSNVESARYADMVRKHSDAQVGTYQRGVTVTALVEDLGFYFTDVSC